MEEVKITNLERFFIILAGHSPEIVQRSTPDEKAKIVTMGMVLLIPVILGGISGGYAATFISNSPHSWTFGFVWATIIYLIDRAIVSVSKTSFLIYAVRIVMAIIIGLVISFPVKVRIFDDVISQQIMEDFNLQKGQLDRVSSQKISRAQQELNQAKSDRDKLWNDYKVEIDGSGGTGKRGIGSIAGIKKAAFLKADKSYLAQKESFDSEKGKILAELSEGTARLSTTQAVGLIGKYKALGRVAEKEPFVKLTSNILWAFFTLLELLPLLIKLMNNDGLYSRISQSDADAKATAVDKANEIKCEAEILAATIPLEQKINLAKVEIAKSNVDSEVNIANMYSSQLVSLFKSERKSYENLKSFKIPQEKMDAIFDKLSGIYDTAAENIFELSGKKSPETVI